MPDPGAVLALLTMAGAVGLIGWGLRPRPPAARDRHRHVPGRPCYPCIARLERECELGDHRATVADGRDALIAEADLIRATPASELTDAQVERLEHLADTLDHLAMFDAAGFSGPEPRN